MEINVALLVGIDELRATAEYVPDEDAGRRQTLHDAADALERFLRLRTGEQEDLSYWEMR